MSESHDVTFNIKVDVTQGKVEVDQFHDAVWRALVATERLTGEENLDAAIVVWRRALAIVNALTAAYRALQLARMGAGDPLAWITAGLEVFAAGGTLASSMQARRPRY